MGLQKYRADTSHEQADGSIQYFANWIGGPTLSCIKNCRAVNLHGEPRVNAYIQGEATTYFAIPAKCYYLGYVLNGYITGEDGISVFHHCYY